MENVNGTPSVSINGNNASNSNQTEPGNTHVTTLYTFAWQLMPNPAMDVVEWADIFNAINSSPALGRRPAPKPTS